MSRTLILDVSDEVYALLWERAAAAGTSPALLAVISLEQTFGRVGPAPNSQGPAVEADRQAARERFTRQIGAVDLGCATGVDNESIDADLAREYANTREPA